MNEMKFKRLFFVILAGLMLPSVTAAQSISLKPGIAWMENDKPGFNVDFDIGYRNEYTIPSEACYPRLVEIDLSASGSLLARPSLNPEYQHVDLFLGYLISFKKAQELTLGQVDEPSGDYGSLGLGLNTNLEANQTFTEINLEQGLELRYVNSSRSYLPIVETSYLLVIPYRSQFRDDLNQENNSFQRFNVRLFWAIRMKQFLLNPDFRYFRSIDLSPVLEENGLDEGFHSAVSLGYVFEKRESGPLQFLEYIYLQYNRGEFPVYLGSRETVELGISFGF
jgi:hypothetical protein